MWPWPLKKCMYLDLLCFPSPYSNLYVPNNQWKVSYQLKIGNYPQQPWNNLQNIWPTYQNNSPPP